MSSEDTPTVALATTKRKFHKLLDNLSATASGSTTSLATTLRSNNASAASLAATPEPASKRSRRSDVSIVSIMERKNRIVSGEKVRAIQDKLFSPQKGNERPSSVRAVGTPGAKSASSPQEPRKPNFAPYDQQAFLARLKTFADVKRWSSSKPASIGEVQWAKRGWSCEAWNTVACKGGCETRLVVSLRPKAKDEDGKDIDYTEDVDVDVEEGLVDCYKDMIVTGHGEGCLWRKGGCKDDIYHLPLANRTLSTAGLLTRYNSFKPILSELPPPEHIKYPDPPASTIAKRLTSTFFNPPGSTSTEISPDTTALAFALFGWSGTKEGHNVNLASCNHCFQRLGLWLYTQQRLTEMSTKLDIPVEQLRLDLLESHREHCPWYSSVTQSNPVHGILKGKAGWETLQFTLSTLRNVKEKASTVDEVQEVGDLQDGEDDTGVNMKGLQERTDGLTERWRRLKTKLKRSASRRSLKSVKSAKSSKSLREDSIEGAGEKGVDS